MTHIYFTQEICSGKPYPKKATNLEPHIVLIILTKQFNTKSMPTYQNIYDHFPISIDYWRGWRHAWLWEHCLSMLSYTNVLIFTETVNGLNNEKYKGMVKACPRLWGKDSI